MTKKGFGVILLILVFLVSFASASNIQNKTIGNESSSISMTEFSDFECPYCKSFWEQTFPQIKTNYIDTGKIKFSVKQLPLTFHLYSFSSAVASECAAEQGKFFEYSSLLYQNQQNLTSSDLQQYALNLNLSMPEFNYCFSNVLTADLVSQEIQEAHSLNVFGTPTFFINSKRLDGAMPYSMFQQEIDRALYNISCFSSSECNDNNTMTIDECINPGSSQSSCRNTLLNCISNSDCGFSGFLGNEFCSSSNLNRLYQNSTCINPGSFDSFCSIQVSQLLTTSCQFGCQNNSCTSFPIACHSNSDCNDQNLLTTDICNNHGTQNASCSHNFPIACSRNADCGDSSMSSLYCGINVTYVNVTFNECFNPGSPLSYCSSTFVRLINNTCPFGCQNNSCLSAPNITNITNQSIINQTLVPFNVTILSPSNGQSFILNSSIPLLFNISGNATNCFYNLDNSQNITLPNCSNSSFLASLGNHSLSIFATGENQTAFDSTLFSVILNQSIPTNVTNQTQQNQTSTNQTTNQSSGSSSSGGSSSSSSSGSGGSSSSSSSSSGSGSTSFMYFSHPTTIKNITYPDYQPFPQQFDSKKIVLNSEIQEDSDGINSSNFILYAFIGLALILFILILVLIFR